MVDAYKTAGRSDPIDSRRRFTSTSALGELAMHDRIIGYGRASGRGRACPVSVERPLMDTNRKAASRSRHGVTNLERPASSQVGPISGLLLEEIIGLAQREPVGGPQPR